MKNKSMLIQSLVSRFIMIYLSLTILMLALVPDFTSIVETQIREQIMLKSEAAIGHIVEKIEGVEEILKVVAISDLIGQTNKSSNESVKKSEDYFLLI